MNADFPPKRIEEKQNFFKIPAFRSAPY